MNYRTKGNDMKLYFLIFAGLFFIISPFLNNSVAASSIVQSNNEFCFDLYGQLKSKKGNLFFSPYSISTALAMTYAGAKGETAKEMAKVLHFDMEDEQVHAAFSKLQSYLNSLQNNQDIELAIANSLWIQSGYPILDSFFKIVTEMYGAGLNFVNFAADPDEAIKKINQWVADKTQQKIKKLLTPAMINELTRMVLCNAIYFKGDWLNPFDSNRTFEDDFYIMPDKAIKVPMMHQKAKFKYKNFGRFSAIELPYSGNDLSMIIFLSNEKDNLFYLEQNLSRANVERWIKELSKAQSSKVVLHLPKFKVSCSFELGKALPKMGMKRAFSSQADFSGITGKRDFYIGNVVHKAFIDVNEQGTEAAAATAVVMQRAMLDLPIRFYVNHPFIFVIQERKTNAILFIGRIVDPSNPN